MYLNLRQYIAELEKVGELKRITDFVDPVLEIAEMTGRECKSENGGKALLFENTGTTFPVLTNMMGSERRMSMTLGVENLTDIEGRLDALFHTATSPKKGLFDKLKMLPLLKDVGNWLPRSYGGKGDCQQITLDSLSQIPILKTWTHDADRFVTLPLVHTIDPMTGARNVGMYRMQVMGDDKTGMHWHRHKTGERHYEAYRERGERMPVTVCLGGDPVYTYAATAPLPDGVDEYLLAGFLRNRPVKLVKCMTNDIEIPSDCDFVIEGYVDTTEPKVVEGPFGDHTGFYSLPDLYPVFHVTCITARKDAVYPATVVGIPPMEDAWIAAATERIFIAPIRFAIAPEIVDLRMPIEGTAHNIAICNIRKTYPGQGFKVGSAMWGAGQMMFNKYMVVLSDGDTIKDRIAYFDATRDTMQTKGTLDVLDHASDTIGFGGKMCFDLTRKLPEEGERTNVDFEIRGEIPGNCRVLADLHTLIFFGEQSHVDVTGLKFIIIFDKAATYLSDSDLLWIAAANSDAVRDVTIMNGVVTIDARPKLNLGRAFPNIVTMDAVTIEAVDKKCDKPSPSLKYRKLIYSDSAAIELKIKS